MKITDPISLIGSRVKIFWPGDKTYYSGLVDDYNTEAETHGIRCEPRTHATRSA